MSATSQVICLATTFMGAGGCAVMALWNVEDNKKKAAAAFGALALTTTSLGLVGAHNLIEQNSAPVTLEAPKAP